MLSIFKRKDPRVNHDFDDEDRQQSTVLRSYRREIVRIQREIEVMSLKRQLQDLRRELSGPADEKDEDDMNIDSVMNRILQLAEMQKTTSQPKEMSDAEIDKILNTTPKEHLKKAKKMKDEDIIAVLKQQYPGYSESSYTKALSKIKSK